jgi:hypothetical protein
MPLKRCHTKHARRGRNHKTAAPASPGTPIIAFLPQNQQDSGNHATILAATTERLFQRCLSEAAVRCVVLLGGIGQRGIFRTRGYFAITGIVF